MASLLDIGLRPSESTDKKIAETLLSAREILCRVHGPQKIVLWDLSIEGCDQARETLRANDRINFEFLHVLRALYLDARLSASFGVPRPQGAKGLSAIAPTVASHG